MSWKKTLKASNNEEVTKNGGESPIVGIQDISSKKCRIEMTKKFFGSLPLKSDLKKQVLLLKKSLAFMSFLLS